MVEKVVEAMIHTPIFDVKKQARAALRALGYEVRE
jgi:hypothetical protein